MDKVDTGIIDENLKQAEAERVIKNAPVHHKGGIYFKEVERSKHHEFANKIEDQRTAEELAWKDQQKDKRDQNHAERVADKDEKLSSILNRNM